MYTLSVATKVYDSKEEYVSLLETVFNRKDSLEAHWNHNNSLSMWSTFIKLPILYKRHGWRTFLKRCVTMPRWERLLEYKKHSYNKRATFIVIHFPNRLLYC